MSWRPEDWATTSRFAIKELHRKSAYTEHYLETGADLMLEALKAKGEP